MKNKTLKIVYFAIFGFVSIHLLKNWQNNNEKTNFEVGKIEFNQTPLEIEAIQTSFKEQVWVVKSKSPMTCFKIVFKNEGSRNFSNQPGILDVLCMTLLEGAGDKDAIKFKKLLDDYSLTISVNPSNDDIVLTASCLSKYFNITVDLICDILSKAHLKQEKIDITKQGLSAVIQQGSHIPEELANEKLNNLIFPENHPYHYSREKTLESIKKYKKDEIDKIYACIFNPNNAIITLSGDLDKKSLISGFNKIQSSISNKKNDFKDVEQKAEIPSGIEPVHIELNNPQSTVMFALPGALRNSSDRFAVKFANEIFGTAGFNSRLWSKIRDKKGLAYTIYTKEIDSDLQCFIKGISYTRPENVKDVIKGITKECKKIYEKGITKEELELFKTYIFANNILDTSMEKLNFVSLCRNEKIQRQDINQHLENYYELKEEEVNDSIKKILNPKKLIFVDCGQSAEKTKKEESSKK